MKKELKIIEGVFNSGEMMLENEYRNVLLYNYVAFNEFGVIDVKIFITQDYSEEEAIQVLDLFTENNDEKKFLAWLPINSSLSCRTFNNFIANEDESEKIFLNLITLFGLRKLSKLSSKNEENVAA
jgi:hypothetical protein